MKKSNFRKFILKLQSNEKIFSAFLVSFLFSFNLFFYGPSIIFFNNQSEFSNPYLGVALQLVLYTLGSTLIFGLVASLRHGINHKRAVSVLLAVSFLLWFHSNVLVWNYGKVFDGTEFQWNEFIAYGVIDLSIWISLLIFVIFKPVLVYNYSRKISLALIGIMFFSLTFTLITTPKEKFDDNTYKFVDDTKFNFSKKKNVIVLILDATQTDVFHELINVKSFLKEGFRDFTYYPDTVSGFPQTLHSVPNILTGKVYNPRMTYFNFLKNSYLDKSLPQILVKEGYRVDLFPFPYVYRSIYKIPEVASNLKLNEHVTIRTNYQDCLLLIDIVLFKSLPHFVKRYVYNSNRWFLKYYIVKNIRALKAKGKLIRKTGGDFDSKFVEKMVAETEVTINKPVFKFYHLAGPHAPFIYDENGKVIDPAKYDERYLYKQKMTWKLKLLIKFLDKLREKKAYNNSMIFLIADHGTGISLVKNVKGTGFPGIKGERISGHKARALPMFLLKNINEKKPFAVSTQQRSLSDIKNIVFDAMKINSGAGKTQLSGTRQFRYQAGKPNSKTFLEYKINGISWFEKSWDGPVKIISSKRQFDRFEHISFGSEGNYRKFKNTGFSKEKSFITSLGNKKTEIQIPVKAHGDIIVRVTLGGTIPKDKDFNILVNRRKIKAKKWEVKTNTFQFTVSQKGITEKILAVTFIKESNQGDVFLQSIDVYE